MKFLGKLALWGLAFWGAVVLFDAFVFWPVYDWLATYEAGYACVWAGVVRILVVVVVFGVVWRAAAASPKGPSRL